MAIGRDTLTRTETVVPAAVETGIPLLVEACEIIDRFHITIRRKAEAELESRIEQGQTSLIASVANGIAHDIAAVHTAVVSRWPSGQNEGEIIKLKLVKRQIYERRKLDLL